MYRTIVVGVNGSDGSIEAARYGAFVATQHRARLVLASAYVPWSGERLRAERTGVPEDMAWAIGARASAERWLADARAEAVGLTSQAVDIWAVEARPVTGLAHVAKRVEADLVILGRRAGRRPAGLLARRLARRVSCPVWIEGAISSLPTPAAAPVPALAPGA